MNIRNRLSWKKTNEKFGLYLDQGNPISEELKMEVVPLYWLKWPDGEMSEDKYNLSRAKQHAMDVVCKEYGEE